MQWMIKMVGVVVTLAALTGCSVVQVSQDYDPRADLSGQGTWQWRQPDQATVGDVRIDNPLLDGRIRRAVESHLAGRKMRQPTHMPDLYISYHLSIEQRIEGNTVYPTFGAWWYGYPWFGGMEAETRIHQYDECRLVIDIHAAETGHLLWRGTGVYRYKTYPNPQAAAESIRKTVDKILLQFPPHPS
ncbi:DUF4136 domain-containing protein [Desulfosarcina ovata]|uniref:DUF4136 domain-containing protein n=1 Tax=Desulfosarcina ovata subsp. ovata TaxID=2752305 RepID=A0A5K8AKU2_9BACT|nr:DUF4136 domain-containing protein [Desulfosarcina ovata]BBO93353.1 hypothetical protein DSCOOX_65330 [Desulfosarcina ovata subsp. ovata]